MSEPPRTQQLQRALFLLATAAAVAAPASSGAPRPTAPQLTSSPTIAGTAQESRDLTATPGTWASSSPVTYAYHWGRCDGSGAACGDIPGANAQTYRLTSADVARTIQVR